MTLKHLEALYWVWRLGSFTAAAERLHSPQSAIFDKSTILYGFDLARPHIQRSGQVAIVEGYMDVVIAHQAGQNNVVGTIGTALTDHHAELLKRIG